MSAKSTSIFESQGFKIGMKYLYGIGAAVVIIGALFKILHLPGASLMLIVGLGTEALIFAVSAFAPLPHEEVHWDWGKVYPQLKSEDDEEEELVEAPVAGIGGGQGIQMDPKTLQSMNNALSPQLFESLSSSIKGLKNGVDNLGTITDASVATQEFADKVRNAGKNIDQLGTGYAQGAETLKQFNSSMNTVKSSQETIANEVKSYQAQVTSATKNLSSLNAVYEIELQDAQKHIGSINKFYGSISNVMQNLLDTSKDTDSLRQEVTSLAKNMKSLNTIYGNMLTAMASGK